MSKEQLKSNLREENEGSGLETEKNGFLGMPEETRQRVVAILNDYIAGMPEFTNVEFKEVMEHAESVFEKNADLFKLKEDTPVRTLVFAYRNLYKKLPHPQDWDPTGKNDQEIADLLTKRFNMSQDFK